MKRLADRRMLAGLSALVFLVLHGIVQADKEKLGACPYTVTHDAPLHATEKVVAETDNHTQFRVEFNGIKGDRVPAFLYVPKSSGGLKPGSLKHPAVLCQYGSGGNKNTNYIVRIGRQFVAHGFVVLTIDSPGRGERKSKDGGGQRGAGFAQTEVLRQYMGDYSRAVDYLVSRPDVDPQRIGYLGISFGAITGIPFVAHDQRIKAMVSMVGGGGFMDRFGSGVSVEAKAAAKQVDPVTHVSLIAPRPLLMINVTKDQLVPKQFAEALHKAAGKGSKIVWKETDHYFLNVDHDELGEELVKFLKENLPKGAK